MTLTMVKFNLKKDIEINLTDDSFDSETFLFQLLLVRNAGKFQ